MDEGSQATGRDRRLTASALPLLAVNAVPLAGVLLLGWSLPQLLVLYWAETGVVAGLALPKLVLVARWRAATPAVKVVVVTGAFMAAHLLLITGIICNWDTACGFERTSAAWADVRWPLGALCASHLLSFVRNFVAGGEWRHTDAQALVEQPMRRVVVMQVTTLVGGFLSAMAGSPAVALAVLVAAKTVADWQAHRAEHRPGAPRR